jgi:hypothetical protein
MGHVISIDMGIAMLRFTIFDRRGRLKQLFKESEEAKEENNAEEEKGFQHKETLSEDGFVDDLTFYSTVHNGTFYFLQFNIARTAKVSLNNKDCSFWRVRRLRYCLYSLKKNWMNLSNPAIFFALVILKILKKTAYPNSSIGII